MRHCWLVVLLVLGIHGCSGETPQNARPPAKASDQAATAASSAIDSPAPNAQGKAKSKGPSPDGARRKLIYTATVELAVEDLDAVQSRLESVVKQFDGYLSHSSVSGSPGYRRSGQWTIRVPVEHYESLLAALRQLGEVQSFSSDSKDVTAEYYDVDAQIRNKKEEEKRLLKLLADATGKLEEILAVERELSRVRGEVEQLEGRLRVLNDLATLTTITLRITEVEKYTPHEAPTYATQLRRAWAGSIDSLVLTARGLSLVGIALLPWLLVLLLPVVLVLLLVRWVRRRRRN